MLPKLAENVFSENSGNIACRLEIGEVFMVNVLLIIIAYCCPSSMPFVVCDLMQAVIL